jgi:hypothetical protein
MPRLLFCIPIPVRLEQPTGYMGLTLLRDI